MNTNLKTPKEIKNAFAGLFDNRTEDEQREDAAQLLSFRFLSEVDRLISEQGLTKRQLASMVGTSASYITQLFRGDRLINMDMLARFERVLEVRFMTGMSEPSVVVTKKRRLKSPSPSHSSASVHR